MRHLSSLHYFEVIAGEKSIRQAADRLNITATALNRRLLALEEEIGVPLFERLASGVRLNPAGELLLQHVRTQRMDLSRVISQIADLSGLRRGHVRIACCSELLVGFMPQQIATYRQEFPEVEYTVHSSEEDIPGQLESLDIDLALSFAHVMPHRSQLVGQIKQAIAVLMQHNHPLAQHKTIRLHDCLNYPMVVPPESNPLRTQLILSSTRKNLLLPIVITTNSPMLRLHYLRYENALSIDYPINHLGGEDREYRMIPLDKRDVSYVHLSIYKAKGRMLPVAVAKFLDHMLHSMNTAFPE